jgi:hypothetical protein
MMPANVDPVSNCVLQDFMTCAGNYWASKIGADTNTYYTTTKNHDGHFFADFKIHTR